MQLANLPNPMDDSATSYTREKQSTRKSSRKLVSNLLAALKDCKLSKCLLMGKQVHLQAIESGVLLDPYIFSSLIDMYARCGCMVEARKVFDSRAHRDLVAWNTLLQGYVENGESELALELFEAMQTPEAGFSPDARSFVAALAGCSSLARTRSNEKERWLTKGKALHSQAILARCCNIFVENKLIDLYSRCGSLELARGVFDSMSERTPVSWATLLQGYVDNDENEVALELFERLESRSTRAFVAALTACGNLGIKGDRSRCLERGRALHRQAVEGKCCDVYVETTLIGMYSRCGSMGEAREVFDKMSRRNVVSWNALLQGYVDNGEFHSTLKLYHEMEENEEAACTPDGRSYVSALAACGALGAAEGGDSRSKFLSLGRAIHSRASDRGCWDIFLESVLVGMYAKCGSMVDARRVFDAMAHRNSVAWNSLLQGYLDNGDGEMTLHLFESMDTSPDARTFVTALNACAALAGDSCDGDDSNLIERQRWLEKGRQIHRQAESSSSCNLFVKNSLIHMYSAFGCISEAREVFDSMPDTRDVVSWNCLVLGYVNSSENELALELIASMDVSMLDCGTFIAGVMACGKLLQTETGRAFHSQILRCGVESNPPVATCLVDFYGKCSRMDAAGLVFDYVEVRDSFIWDSLLSGYTQRGDSELVLEIFQEMVELGVSPSEITFTHLLCACSRVGMTEKGRRVFDAMRSLRFGVRPNFKHYNCLIDLLSRANLLDEALRVAREMPREHRDLKTWTTILSACVKWNNSVVGKVAYEALLELNHQDPAAYVLMANIYSSFKT